MSLNKTVYPPQSFPFQTSYPYNVTGIQISVLAIQIRNPPLTTVHSVQIDASAHVATIASVFTVTVA